MSLSIRTKLVIFISFLIVIALSVYVLVAVGLYNKDKKAYIFDSSLSTAESLQFQIERIVDDSFTFTSAFSTLAISNQNFQDVFYKNNNFVEFRLYEKIGNRYQEKAKVINSASLKEVGADENFLKKVEQKYPPEFSRIVQRKKYIKNSTSTDSKLPMMTIGLSFEKGQYIGFARVKLESILKSFQQSQVYDTYLITNTSELLAHSDPKKFEKEKKVVGEKYVENILNGNVLKGVREIANSSGKNIVVAFAKIPSSGLIVISEIEKEKAFLISRELTRRSIVFGGFILGISLILGIIFARSFTRPVQRLYLATQNIAKGDFSKPVEVKTRDEIGRLAMSFNFMMGRIISLMQKEKERVSLEKELEVAQRVQNAFIPPSRIDLKSVKITSFYTPSASCGGDWWNVLESEEKIVFMIGDATGHGIPAAMVTATAASCSSVLKRMLSIDRAILESPASILSLFNTAVYDATKGQIVMTFFIAVYDKNSRNMKYSCASHNSPLLYCPTKNNPSKKDLKPLNKANGPILGLNPDSEFPEAEIKLQRDSSLVLYTDGLIECTNSNMEEWGRRNFVNTIISNRATSPQPILDSLVANAGKHFAGFPLKDDITLVIAEFKIAVDASLDTTVSEATPVTNSGPKIKIA